MTVKNEKQQILETQEIQDLEPEDVTRRQKTEGEEEQRKNPAKLFLQRSLGALLVTGFLFVASFLLFQSTLSKQEDYVKQVNIIEKQTKLSQEISKKILVMKNCTSEKRCLEDIHALEKILLSFENLEMSLIREDSLLQKDGIRILNQDTFLVKNARYYQPFLRDCYTSIKTKQKELQARRQKLNQRIIQGFHNTVSIEIDKIVYIQEPGFVSWLNELALAYNKAIQSYIRQVRFFQLLVLLGGLLVLYLEWTFLFKPIVKRIILDINTLHESHQESKAKNKEISDAYRQLKIVEEVTRVNAEALKKTNDDLMVTQDRLKQTHQELLNKNQALEDSYDEINAHKQLEAARFLDVAMNQFSEVMRWKTDESIQDWTDNLLKELVPYVGGLQAVVYVYDAEKRNLFLTGSYAVEQESLFSKVEFELGDSLIGQAAKSLKTIHLQKLNGKIKEYTLHSGTEQIIPQSLFVLPLVYNNKLAGVLEMSSAKKLEEKYCTLLERMRENIGANLSTLQDQKRINQLFADSQMAQKRLKKTLIKIGQNEERFRKLSEVTQEGLVFVNNNMMKDVNTVLVRIMGYETEKELWNKHYINLIAPKYRFEIEDKKMLNDGHIHETSGIKKNGEIFPVEIQSRVVKYGDEEMTVISIRDITERKKTERELEEANRIASLVTELEKKNKDIMSSIEYAQRIQEAILPSNKLIGKGFLENFVLYIPKDIVSGDFYWCAEKNEHALVAAVDCTGHGVPGAFMSIIGYSNLNKIVMEQGETDPAVILNKLDKEVTAVLKQREENSQSRDGMDLGLCSLNIYEKTLSFAGAYRPMYLIREGELQEFRGNSFPIGGNFKYKKKKIFTSHEVKLEKGDTIYIFSDGYPDQFGGEENKKYMTKKFKKLLLSMQSQHLSQQKEILQKEFVTWKGKYKQMDDILVMGLRF